MRVSRRALLLSAGAAAAGSAFARRRSFADAGVTEIRLAATPAVVNLTGNGYPGTAVWAYDGTNPGPEHHPGGMRAGRCTGCATRCCSP